jgi:hypothetical protein
MTSQTGHWRLFGGSPDGPQVVDLAEPGVTEQTMGCPIRSSLEVELIGELSGGMPVAMDKHAFDADAFVVVNRVKPHTEFTHPFESGLMKMMAIGMGKEFGATLYHRYFLRDSYGATIEAIVDQVTYARPLLFGVGIAEDGHGQTAEVEIMPAATLEASEAAMLDRVRVMMPRLPFDDLDVLVIDEMDKDISGSGFITDRLYNKIDRQALYVNALAGSEPEHARIPMVLPTDQAAVDDRVRVMMPKLPFDDLDVLVIDEMGKDISGSGFDTKVVGRLSMPLLARDPEKPNIKRIVVCDLTDVSAGNADGVGIDDFISDRLYNKIDRQALYVNALAGSEPEHARIPMVLPTDQAAVEAAIATIGPVDADSLRLVHITNTKDLATVEISAALLAECADRNDLTLVRDLFPLSYTDGALTPVAHRDWHDVVFTVREN